MNFVYKFCLPLAVAGLMASCSAGKKATSENRSHAAVNSKAPPYDKIQFDRVYFEAVKEKMVGNYSRAAHYFEEALQVNERSSAAWYELGRCYLKLTQLDVAEASTLKATQYDKTNPYYLQQLSEIYRYRRKYTEAADVYTRLIELEPDKQDHYLELAQLQEATKKPSEALKTYEKFEKRFGPNPEITSHKLQLYVQDNKMDKAEAELQKLLKAEPDNTFYNRLLAEVYLAGGKEDKALEVYNNLLKRNPDDGDAQLAMADYFLRKGNDKEAMKMLEKAFANPTVELDRKTAILYNNFLMSPSQAPEVMDHAAVLAEKLVKAHPNDAKVYAVQGDILAQQQKLEEARTSYRKALEKETSLFSVWQQLLLIETQLKDNKALEMESEKALEYFPNQPTLYFFNGLAKMEQKEYKKSIEMFESGLAQSVDQPKLEAQFYLNLAEAYYRMQNYDKSDAYFDKLLDKEPNNALALNNYAYYLSERKDKLEKAAEMSKKSLLKEPDNASYLDTYGWILYRQGQYEQAEKYIGRSLKRDVQSAEVNEHYGDVQYKLGNTDKALEYWKLAKQYGAASSTLDKKISDKKLYE